jgi:hypothetical protein
MNRQAAWPPGFSQELNHSRAAGTHVSGPEKKQALKFLTLRLLIIETAAATARRPYK